jgi:hypothetical protein
VYMKDNGGNAFCATRLGGDWPIAEFKNWRN